jgi:hypothetical protein
MFDNSALLHRLAELMSPDCGFNQLTNVEGIKVVYQNASLPS